MIDSHAHLTMPQFDEDREEVLHRAREAGVGYILTVGAVEEGPSVIEFVRRHEDYGISAAIGVHPHEASSFSDESARALQELSHDPKVAAIGEIGLDYHYQHSPVPVQQEAFRRQIRIAREAGLPIMVHGREADEDILKILREEKADEVRGVIHCFSGGIETARTAISLGFFISFSGSLTFRNAASLRETARAVPIERILIETDSPYLAPQQVRGKRNEPSYVRFVAETLAEVKGLSFEDISRITSHNAMQILSLGSMETPGKIAYQIRESLYLNVTNRCTNTCGFCVRFYSDFVKGHNLRMATEPSAPEVIRAIGDPKRYREVVFCGYGEPLLRLDLVKEVALWIKEHGGRVRINTNGQGNLIHKRNILPELNGLVDVYSVSLNAENEEKYLAICKPVFGPGAYRAVKAFILEAGKGAEVNVTVVALPDVDIPACRKIALEELKAGFRVRYYDEVG
ncbi:MAG: radical SAM protein [Nitrospirae bacterium CG_4_9_14_3_um_filter_53_35]|nr:MAG: radical SAM protein [Nitrospirae bacterium CG08_land_8_20_14_0_20_52_24]PIV85667.1 MAG: radical SAM protein [Nitrospirae bacterium CG17_big_fil_post_rev_8_21_14_2_50_50_9]PIW85182.1 MAG: radical SAM protein [Nitrospirae bacterium CG_4_8_14_3_um_filter_50_41]PIX86713.1 MAG: radical SAM protein [Nitrospirae bacterium CG_4_10_14_3_um_filter_53_41]PJA75442.1 MAG: radical SAM protein [Nitrospirae bacterium CG_4_9_14_3_um_filter_53_35]